MALLAASLLPAAARALDPADADAYRAAFRAADAGDWAGALAAARQATDPVLVDVIVGRDYTRDGAGHGFADIAAFVARRPDWPTVDILRRQAEAALGAGIGVPPPAQVLGYFESFPPLTGAGLLGHADALAATGQADRAARAVAAAWADIPLGAADQAALLQRHGAALSAVDHQRRLDRLLWQGRDGEVARMLPLVDAGWRALAEARQRLADRAAGVDAAIEAVPAALRDDEGLVYERLRWRRRADLTQRAIELLDREPAGSPNGADWWRERHILARRLFNDGDPAGAYRVASGHRLTGGFPLAQAEWFSGWLALRFLGDPATAVIHFRRLYESVDTPISLARGAYWTGRALEAGGDRAGALGWFQRAAQHPTAFYGQLAADHLDLPTITSFPPPPAVGAAARARFAESDGARIVSALVAIDQTLWADRFLLAMADATTDPAQLALTGELALAEGRLWGAVRTGKAAAGHGVSLVDAAYPLIALDDADPRVEPALVLAIIRQESEFRPAAISHAGARGLMQLMPATAQGVARQLGLAHSTGMLTSDTAHNIRLGSTYLADRIATTGGSFVLAIAGYNAGPGRVRSWVEERGDPRRADVDVIDWIESIPIYETRNYVQRVMEAVEIYRRQLGAPPRMGALEQDLAR